MPWVARNKKRDALQGQKYNEVVLLLPLQGVTSLLNSTQGVALGYGLHWAFSPPLRNLKVE